MDTETKTYMKLPRCGMPDITQHSSVKRKRRFTKQGTHWRNTVGVMKTYRPNIEGAVSFPKKGGIYIIFWECWDIFCNIKCECIIINLIKHDLFLYFMFFTPFVLLLW